MFVKTKAFGDFLVLLTLHQLSTRLVVVNLFPGILNQLFELYASTFVVVDNLFTLNDGQGEGKEPN